MKFNPFSSANYSKNQNDEQPVQEQAKLVSVATEELEEMKKVIMLASKMRSLLEQCRYESLPMSLARKIDDILREAQQFD